MGFTPVPPSTGGHSSPRKMVATATWAELNIISPTPLESALATTITPGALRCPSPLSLTPMSSSGSMSSSSSPQSPLSIPSLPSSPRKPRDGVTCWALDCNATLTMGPPKPCFVCSRRGSQRRPILKCSRCCSAPICLKCAVVKSGEGAEMKGREAMESEEGAARDRLCNIYRFTTSKLADEVRIKEMVDTELRKTFGRFDDKEEYGRERIMDAEYDEWCDLLTAAQRVASGHQLAMRETLNTTTLLVPSAYASLDTRHLLDTIHAMTDGPYPKLLGIRSVHHNASPLRPIPPFRCNKVLPDRLPAPYVPIPFAEVEDVKVQMEGLWSGKAGDVLDEVMENLYTTERHGTIEKYLQIHAVVAGMVARYHRHYPGVPGIALLVLVLWCSSGSDVDRLLGVPSAKNVCMRKEVLEALHVLSLGRLAPDDAKEQARTAVRKWGKCLEVLCALQGIRGAQLAPGVDVGIVVQGVTEETLCRYSSIMENGLENAVRWGAPISVVRAEQALKAFAEHKHDSVCFIVHGMGSKLLSLSECSPYPAEGEYLLPPFHSFTPTSVLETVAGPIVHLSPTLSPPPYPSILPAMAEVQQRLENLVASSEYTEVTIDGNYTALSSSAVPANSSVSSLSLSGVWHCTTPPTPTDFTHSIKSAYNTWLTGLSPDPAVIPPQLLFEAITTDDVPRALALTSEGPCDAFDTLQLQQSNGWSALHLTASREAFATSPEGLEVLEALATPGSVVRKRHPHLTRLQLINMQEPQLGATALHLAASHGFVDAARTLIDCGLNADVLNYSGMAALHFAMNSGAFETESGLKVLSKMTSHITVRSSVDGLSAIHHAVQLRQAGALKVLLKHCRDYVDVIDEHGRTPLHLAVEQEALELIDTLIDNGADVNILHDGLTCLEKASDRIAFHAPDAASTLLRLATPNANPWLMNRDILGRTHLHLVAMQGWSGMVSAILASGFPAGLPDKSGRCPLELAVEFGQGDRIRVVKALSKATSQATIASFANKTKDSLRIALTQPDGPPVGGPMFSQPSSPSGTKEAIGWFRPKVSEKDKDKPAESDSEPGSPFTLESPPKGPSPPSSPRTARASRWVPAGRPQPAAPSSSGQRGRTRSLGSLKPSASFARPLRSVQTQRSIRRTTSIVRGQ